MSQKQTVIINGRHYDAHTGLPVSAEHAHTSRAALRSIATEASASTPQQPTSPRQNAHSVHKKTQKSATLNRKFIKKPAARVAITTPIAVATPHQVVPKSAPRIDGIRRPMATAPQHQLAPQKKQPALQPLKRTPLPVRPSTPTAHPQEVVRKHPIEQRVHAVHAARKQPTQAAVPAASVLKQAAINEAMNAAPKHHAKQHKQRSHRSRFAGLAFGCMALVMFGGYLTYLNVPNLSVRVAAAQAGIDASYPGYRPDGYRLNGPVAYSDGQVRMQFAANTGETDFTLNQSKSSWDSSALLENYVRDEADDEYTTSQEKGITIYSYDGNAAWVSGGILYTINGDAPLSPDQIRKIATSV